MTNQWLEKNEIISGSVIADVLDPIVAVYFLIDKGQIVYVGKSTDLIFRLTIHRKEGKKGFDSYYFIRSVILIISKERNHD